MPGRWWTLIKQGTKLTAIAVVALYLFFLSIDSVEFARSGSVSSPSKRGMQEYAEKISVYSLVSIRALQISSEQAAVVARTGPIFLCIGNLRTMQNDTFIDLTALTVAIAGIENYNRGIVRRAAENVAQDFVRMLGGTADYTIGLTQVRSSLAETVYRRKIDKSASREDIARYARSDCGSVRLAALHIEDLVESCAKADASLDLDGLVDCTVLKYTGMRESQREYAIYSAAITYSYRLLFDTSNEFYLSHFVDSFGIRTIMNGECFEFNAGRAQMASIPADKGARQSFSLYNQTKLLSDFEAAVVDSEKIEYTPAITEEQGGIIKVLTPEIDRGLDFRKNVAISIKRRQLIAEYACAKFKPIAVEFYSSPDFIPGRVGRYCSGSEAIEVPAGMYLLLNTTGNTTKRATGASCPVSSSRAK